jgi:hypothetical protein
MGLDKVCNFLQQMMGLNISCILVGIPKVGFSLSLSFFFLYIFFPGNFVLCRKRGIYIVD